jgi:putative heme-binding domain-containing protein
LRIYLDGELNQDQGRVSLEPLTGLRLGESCSGKPCAARFDEFRVWDVARSAEEIRDNFRTRLDTEIPPHLVKRFSGDQPGALVAPALTERTRDFPQLFTAAQAQAAAQRFARFRAMTDQPGDPVAGRALFQASCLICHQVKGEGTQIGPDLSGVGAMGIQGILRNVLDPNAQLESGYYRHDVTLTDGSLVSGFLVEETKETLTIRAIGADPKVIPLNTVANHSISKRSLMPEGLIDGFSEKQVADLFSYINSLK